MGTFFHARRSASTGFVNYCSGIGNLKLEIERAGQAGLEAAFQIPMAGDSGLSPDAGSISNSCLTQEIFTPTPADCCPSISLKQCFGQ